MKPYSDELAEVEVSDLIRINQLVRGATDTAGLGQWYGSLAHPEQTTLIVTLMDFAHQARPQKGEWHRAIETAGLVTNPELVERLRAYVDDQYYSKEDGFHYNWLHTASEPDRAAAFWFAAHLFGFAARRQLRSCQCDGRYHWWHRGLTDERVVRELLAGNFLRI
jgi:hypothetical protein